MAGKMRVETIGKCTLYLGDCIEIMDDLGPVDAVVTDPPYCSGASTEATRGSATHQGLRSKTMRGGRFQWFDADNMTTAGLCTLLRSMCVHAPVSDKGSILAFCDWRMVTMLAPTMESAGWRLRNLIVWDKGHFGAGTGFRPRHELILHLSRRSPEFYSQSVGNVISCPRVGRDRLHPTQKPIGLLSELIGVVTPHAGTVLDPFMGSGSTGVAALKLGRSFVGIEASATHYESALRRIEAAHKEPSMLAAVEQPAEQTSMFDADAS